MKFSTDHIMYGGDYNPDQWLERPDILDEDIRLMKLAGVSVVSTGIFAWQSLEPSDGDYQFDWLEEIINRLYENGISTIMATPSGARPHWLADKYPDVLRKDKNRTKMLFGHRHNHCFTSPSYRKKVHDMNRKLAERFDQNPAVILWHISNEYGGECHCELCQEAFRGFLKKRYGTIKELNRAWNNTFWSHRYDSFDQVESPTEIGEMSIHGLNLDWKRFVSYQSTDFCKAEIEALREGGATKPATTNMMYFFNGINYHELADVIDITCWDNYPNWHKGNNPHVAMDTALMHDIMRSLKRQPFLLMESCPGSANWKKVSKLPKPGMMETAGLLAVAEGSDSIQYFQMRKGRGGEEKFHGALIDHYGKEDDRVFEECKRLGNDLPSLKEVAGSEVKAEVAVIYDWENRWALEDAAGPRNCGLYYQEAVLKNYQGFKHLGINVDVIDQTQSLDPYKVVVLPMCYMFRPGFADRVREFTENGGTLIMSYWSGVVDDNDLCFLGGTPGGLMDVMGLRSSEIDGLYDGETNTIVGDGKSYSCEHLCQIVLPTTAKTLMTYGEDFYQGCAALTKNIYGKGEAYYVCADAEAAFYNDVYGKIAEEKGLIPYPAFSIPEGVMVSTRSNEKADYIFIQNFNEHSVEIDLSSIDGEIILNRYAKVTPPLQVSFEACPEGTMPAYASIVIRKEK